MWGWYFVYNSFVELSAEVVVWLVLGEGSVMDESCRSLSLRLSTLICFFEFFEGFHWLDTDVNRVFYTRRPYRQRYDDKIEYSTLPMPQIAVVRI